MYGSYFSFQYLLGYAFSSKSFQTLFTNHSRIFSWNVIIVIQLLSKSEVHLPLCQSLQQFCVRYQGNSNSCNRCIAFFLQLSAVNDASKTDIGLKVIDQTNRPLLLVGSYARTSQNIWRCPCLTSTILMQLDISFLSCLLHTLQRSTTKLNSITTKTLQSGQEQQILDQDIAGSYLA